MWPSNLNHFTNHVWVRAVDISQDGVIGIKSWLHHQSQTYPSASGYLNFLKCRMQVIV